MGQWALHIWGREPGKGFGIHWEAKAAFVVDVAASGHRLSLVHYVLGTAAELVGQIASSQNISLTRI
jgi:hypothetical protein